MKKGFIDNSSNYICMKKQTNTGWSSWLFKHKINCVKTLHLYVYCAIIGFLLRCPPMVGVT